MRDSAHIDYYTFWVGSKGVASPFLLCKKEARLLFSLFLYFLLYRDYYIIDLLILRMFYVAENRK